MYQKFKLLFCVIKNLLTLKEMEPIPIRRLHITSTAIRLAVAGVSPQDARQYINYVVDFVSRSQSHKSKLSTQSMFWLKKPPSAITVSQAILLLKRNAEHMHYVINVLFSLIITILMICIFSQLGWDGEQLKECLIDHER